MTLPIVAAGGFAVKMAADFDQAMRNVNSIMGVSGKELDRYSKQVLDFSTKFPQSATTLANGLYSIASSGFAGAEGMKVLEASARAASAGLTDTETSSKAITAVLNAYGLAAEDAAAVSDVLFTGVDKGVMSFEELAASVGDYVGAASQLGLSLEEVVGAQAAMTLTGISAAESATSLNAIIRSMLKPSDDLKEALKDLGYESGQAALEAEGLDGVMALIADEVGDNKSKWVELFPEIRAARGAMALAADDGSKLAGVMDEMAEASGHTEAAFREQAKGASFKFTLALNRLKKAGIELGNQLIPILVKNVIPALQKLLKWWQELSPEAQQFRLKILGIAAALGPFMRIFGGFVTLVGKLVGWLPKVVGWLLRWAGIKAFPVATGPVVAGAPGGKTQPVVGAAGKGILKWGGMAALAYATIGQGTVPETAPLEEIQQHIGYSDDLRKSIYGVSDAEQALAKDVEFLNGWLAEQGLDLKVNKRAFEFAAVSGIGYQEALAAVAFTAGVTSKTMRTDLANVFAEATGWTDKQKVKVAGLADQYVDLGGKLNDADRDQLAIIATYGEAETAIRFFSNKIAEATPKADAHAEATSRQDEKLRALADSLGTSTSKLEALKGGMDDVKPAAEKAGTWVDWLRGMLDKLPDKVTIPITVDVDQQAVNEHLAWLEHQIQNSGGTTSGGSSGGSSGGGGNDDDDNNNLVKAPVRVVLDRTRFARDLDVEYAARGW